MSAGYSGTPLPKKLGIKEASTVLLVDPPDNIDELLVPLPNEVVLARTMRKRGPFDVVLLFALRQADLTKRYEASKARLDKHGGLWVCWPKKASKVPTDLTEDLIRKLGLSTGLVDNKVCAVDATWSGLRLCYRRKDR